MCIIYDGVILINLYIIIYVICVINDGFFGHVFCDCGINTSVALLCVLVAILLLTCAFIAVHLRLLPSLYVCSSYIN